MGESLGEAREQPGANGTEEPGKPASSQPEVASKRSHFDEQDGGTRADQGAATARRHAVDEALSMFGSRTSGVVIIGDSNQIGTVAGGDSVGGDPTGPALEQIAPSAITDLAEVFVPPAGFESLVEPIGRYRMSVLGTRPRWGNTAIAIRILDSARGIHRLRYRGPLASLPVERLPADSGFILEAPDTLALAALRLQYLGDLQDRLAKAGSRLVVITDVDRATDHGARPVWRTVPAPPDAYRLVLRHMTRRLASEEQGTELIEQTGLGKQLRDMSSDTFDIHRLTDLAADLAEAARGRGTLAEATERFAARADRAVEEWFDTEVTDDAARAIVLAQAVLDGMPYDAVSRAANLLERRWADQEVAGTGPGKSRKDRHNRRTRLKAARVRLSRESWRTHYGPAELEIARFIDGSYPQRILRHYWYEHDYDRELLLAWLRDVADDVEVPVGTRAAIAVGYLGTLGFDIVRREVIVPWVSSGKGNERELAVAALALPARTPDTAGRAIALVGDWSRRTGWTAKVTAARALGRSVGTVLSDRPDAWLSRLAKGADGQLATALGESVAELVADADPDRQRQTELLGLFDTWSAEGRNGRQLAGALGFLQASWTLWTEVDGLHWPSVLWLAEQGEASRELIARLWGRALITPGADSGVRVVLNGWARTAERHAGMRSAFVGLFCEAAATPRQAALLQAHAKRLRTGRPGTPNVASKLLDALTFGGIRRD